MALVLGWDGFAAQGRQRVLMSWGVTGFVLVLPQGMWLAAWFPGLVAHRLSGAASPGGPGARWCVGGWQWAWGVPNVLI